MGKCRDLKGINSYLKVKTGRANTFKVASHKVCKAESYSEIFEPSKAQKNFGNNFLVI
jgi:hypothetical protein